MEKTKLIPNDAMGGSGSIADSLRGIATLGLSRAVDGYFSKKYPLTAFNDNGAYNTSGQLRPGAAPGSRPAGTGSQLAGLLGNPTAIAIGVAVAIAVLVVFVVKR